jgi:hypothetical protein
MTTDRYGNQVQTVRRGEMPEFARELPDVGRVYRFATEAAPGDSGRDRRAVRLVWTRDADAAAEVKWTGAAGSPTSTSGSRKPGAASRAGTKDAAQGTSQHAEEGEG